ncbi:MAG: hypothetical protein M1812_007789 [Candelaria pacifica]|nr:MAG: hypothetical protein M1812_007789 [Candelaria pacifica]
MNLLDLPLELVELVVEHMVIGVGLYKAVRLRLLSKFFDRLVLQALFRDGNIDFPYNLRTSWMSESFTVKLLMAKTQASKTVKYSVIHGVIDRAMNLLRDKDGHLEEERRLQYTHALCAAMVANVYISDVRDYLDIKAEDKNEYVSEEYDFWNALAAVVSVGDIPKLQELLDRGIPNSSLGIGLCGLPTTVAAGQGQYEVLQYLLDGDFTQYEAVQYRLRHGADAEYDFSPALHRAAEAGHEDLVRLLLAPKYDIGKCHGGGVYGDAMIHAGRGGHVAITELLDDYVPDKRISYTRNEVFLEAAINGRTQIVQMMIDEGIDIEKDDHMGRTALDRAAVPGHASIIRLLLASGAPATGYNAAEALVGAAKNGHEDAVQALLDAGADINAKGRKNNPLGAAACNGEARMIRYLLEKGADPMATTFGCHGLWVAAAKGHEAVVRVLVEAGVDINGPPEDESRNPMLNALSAAQIGVVRLLRRLGARNVDPLKSIWREQFETSAYPIVRYHE